jgi:hypothetical protein
MSNALDIMIAECSRSLDGIRDTMAGLSPDDRMKLDYAIHEAQLKIWKAEEEARTDWYANTRFATDPFIRQMAFVYTGGYFVVIGLTWVAGIPTSAHDTVLTLIGALTAAQLGITTYCFGNTSAGMRKDTMIYHSTPTKDDNP